MFCALQHSVAFTHWIRSFTERSCSHRIWKVLAFAIFLAVSSTLAISNNWSFSQIQKSEHPYSTGERDIFFHVSFETIIRSDKGWEDILLSKTSAAEKKGLAERKKLFASKRSDALHVPAVSVTHSRQIYVCKYFLWGRLPCHHCFCRSSSHFLMDMSQRHKAECTFVAACFPGFFFLTISMFAARYTQTLKAYLALICVLAFFAVRLII